MQMSQKQALEVLARNRSNQIVITTMSTVGIWPEFSDTPADFFYIPSTMGQGPSFALGLALAQEERGVIAINGDGCTLMNLGCLVTIAGNPANICLIVMDNGVYEITGGQETAGSRRVDFAAAARAAGIEKAYSFNTVEEWDHAAADILAEQGPVLVHLCVQARMGQVPPKPPRPMSAQIERMRKLLGTS